MRRRQFIALLSGLFPVVSSARLQVWPSDNILQREILTFAVQRGRSVGAKWLHEQSISTSATILLNTLTKKLRHQSAASDDFVNVAASFRRQIREDFENGRTQSVNGWILAQTEAELFALASLARTDKAVA